MHTARSDHDETTCIAATILATHDAGQHPAGAGSGKHDLSSIGTSPEDKSVTFSRLLPGANLSSNKAVFEYVSQLRELETASVAATDG